MAKVSTERIQQFFDGFDPQKYIINIEASYYSNKVHLIINDPVKGKSIKTKELKPFMWVKESGIDALYNGNREKLKTELRRAGIKVKLLNTTDETGVHNDRMLDGYKYLFTGKGSPGDLLNFVKNGGSEVFSKDKTAPRHFLSLPPVEQYMIQSGKRLFKGFDDYNDLHRLQFDLETTGLDPRVDRIFQIGIKDNREYESIIEIKSQSEFELGFTPLDSIKPIIKRGISQLTDEAEKDAVKVLMQRSKFNKPLMIKTMALLNDEDKAELSDLIKLDDIVNREKNQEELKAIKYFFDVIKDIKPDTIAGYNSENFDWDFFFVRCEVLGYNVAQLAETLDKTLKLDVGKFGKYDKLKRKRGTLKLGQETENFQQTVLWGYNIIDVSHAVRRAQAINSDIKKWGLKYITEFSKANKPNRVYVEGSKIYKTWIDKDNTYAFNDVDGDHYIITEDNPIKEGYTEVKGDYIVQRYLKDDLWETEKVDDIYSQASFLIGKMLPTTYNRTYTMGTATLWKLLMLTWSYENGLAVPNVTPKRTFTGGLARLLEVGRAENVIKFDYAALYPNIGLSHDIFPKVDTTNVMEGLLLYIADTRDEYKFLKNEYAEKGDAYLESLYDKKQLPLKILANSFFGSLGAPHLFNWGAIDSAEEITCRGRIYLRLLVKYFWKKHGFRPLVGDSVTGRTPIYIKYKDTGFIDIIPIQDAFNKNTIGERDFGGKEFLVLTKTGWVEIEYVYRHLTDKPIHRVTTRDRFIECTSDHSLFSDGIEKKPIDFNRGDKIDVYDLKLNDTLDMDLEEAWLMGFFVADGSAIYGDRKQKYFSKRKNKDVYHKGKRSEWTLNNQDYSKLMRSKKILDKMFNLDVKIKDYNKSSNVFKLKTHYRKVAEKFVMECYDNNRIKKIPLSILNSNIDVKKAFINGFSTGDGWGDSIPELKNLTQKSQNVMAGVNLILKELGIDFTLKLRKDKENIIAFNLGEKYPVNILKSFRKTDLVWSTDSITNPDNYVYDISANGTFIAGVGGIIAHNTDGFNFAIPDDIENFSYVGTGKHRFTEKDKVYTGSAAAVAEFNDLYMIGRMGLDIDEYCRVTINFSRKNYVDIISKPDGGEKIKFVGNTIKSKKMPIYIEEFLANAIEMLLENRGQEFLEYYYDYIDKIYNCQIPLVKIASKGKVKLTKRDYLEKCKKLNKKGNPLPRQAHMELMMRHNLDLDLGEIIYYVNTGTAKSHGDLKTIKHKDGRKEVQLNCMLIPAAQIENNPDLTTDEYNVLKYITMFNKRITPLLVVFSEEVRSQILIEAKKDKKSKEVTLESRKEFSKAQCVMTAGVPYEPEDQDTYEELMAFEDKELRFWSTSDKKPNNLEDIDVSEEMWVEMIEDYKVREIEMKRLALEKEMKTFKIIRDRIELVELKLFMTYCETDLDKAFIFLENYFPFIKVDIVPDVGVNLVSKAHDKVIGELADVFSEYETAEKRDIFYTTLHLNYNGDKFQAWLDHGNEIAALMNTGDTKTKEVIEEVEQLNPDEDVEEFIPDDNTNETEDVVEDEWNF